MRQQLLNFTGPLSRQPHQHDLEIGIRIMPVHAGRLDQTNDSRTGRLRMTAFDPKQTLLDDCSRPQADVYPCTTEMTRADARLVTKWFDFSDVLNQKLQPRRQLPAT